MKVLVDMQLAKLDIKFAFIDEYDKFVNHKAELLKVYQGQMLGEAAYQQALRKSGVE